MSVDQKILLAVLAHPDDETFGTGGTLALYARQGVAVHLICATRGEVGEMDEKYMRGFNTIAERREAELRCAAELLDLAGVYFLNYRDSGMPGSADNQHPQALAAQPVEQVAEEIANYIRSIHPQVVITFDPIGGYRHPDHIAIHKATVAAFEQTSAAQENAPQKLYFQTIPRVFLRWVVRFMKLIGRDPRRFGKNGDIDLQSIAEVSFPTHAVVDYRSVADIRDEASACHASQGGASLTGSGLIGKARKLFMSKELYMRAYPPVQSGAKLEKDLFEGI
jgi:LmbE family N-acetylglucosaminyl deacetylase